MNESIPPPGFQNEPDVGLPVGGVPWARPVRLTQPFADASSVCAHPMLLGDTRRLVALADIGVFLGAVLIAFAIELAVLSGLAWYYGLSLEDDEVLQAFVVPALVLRATALTAAIAAIVRYRRQSAGSLGLTGRSLLLNIGLGIAATLVIYAVIFAGVLLIMVFAPALAEQLQKNPENLRRMIPRMHPLEFFAVATLVAFYEELIFRGFLMTRLRRWCGSWTLAVVISSVLFTALHMLEQEPASMIFVGVLALILSVVTIWRRSLVPAIIAHLLFDFSQFIGVFYLS